MTVIGLCGGSGAGKTTASDAMRKKGAAIIDTDRVYRELCVAGSECIAELATAFGEDILTENGELDRRVLASIVYADGEARETLNVITHKHIKEKTVSLIKRYKDEGKLAVIVDAPLLFESGFDLLCDVTVGVIADKKTRIERIVARDGIDREHAEARIRAQYSEEFLRDRCEYILENNNDADSLARAAVSLYEEILKGAK